MKRQVLAAAVLVFAVVLQSSSPLLAGGLERAVKYTLYIGLNDKDTYQQEISTAAAEALVMEIALRSVDGFTITSARGVYTDDVGVVTVENTLVCEFLFASEEQILRIMDEILAALNQNSILVERQEVDCQFYLGARMPAAAAAP